MKGVCAPGHVRTRHAGRGGRSDAVPLLFLSSYDLIIYFKIIDETLISCDAFWLLKELILVF